MLGGTGSRCELEVIVSCLESTRRFVHKPVNDHGLYVQADPVNLMFQEAFEPKHKGSVPTFRFSPCSDPAYN